MKNIHIGLQLPELANFTFFTLYTLWFACCILTPNRRKSNVQLLNGASLVRFSGCSTQRGRTIAAVNVHTETEWCWHCELDITGPRFTRRRRRRITRKTCSQQQELIILFCHCQTINDVRVALKWNKQYICRTVNLCWIITEHLKRTSIIRCLHW